MLKISLFSFFLFINISLQGRAVVRHWSDDEIKKVIDCGEKVLKENPYSVFSNAIWEGAEYRYQVAREINYLWSIIKKIAGAVEMEDSYLVKLKVNVYEKIEKDKKIAKNLIQLLNKVKFSLGLGKGEVFKKMQLVEGLEAAKKLLYSFGEIEKEVQGKEINQENDDQWIEFVKGKTLENYQYNLSDDLEECGHLRDYFWVFCDTGKNIYTLEKGRGLKTLLLYLWLAISKNTCISQYGEKIRPLFHSSLFAGVYLPEYNLFDKALASVEGFNEKEKDELRNIYFGKQEFTWLSFDRSGRVALWEAHNGYTEGGGHSIEGRLHQVLNRFPYNVPKDSSSLASQLNDECKKFSLTNYTYADFIEEAVNPDQATAGSIVMCKEIGTYFALLPLDNGEIAVFGNMSDLQKGGKSDFGYAIYCINANQLDGKDVYYLRTEI